MRRRSETWKEITYMSDSTEKLSEQRKNGSVTPSSLTLSVEPSTCGITQPSTPSSPTYTKPLSGDLRHTSEILETVLEDIYTRGTEPRYPTGLKSLDEVIWGMHKKELMIIGARTSQGKTSLAMQMAMNLADGGNRVGYFSLEMSAEQLMERMIAHAGRIDARLIRHGLAKETVKRAETFLRGFIPNLKILFDDQSGYAFENIISICEELRFDFVFVDYIQMISSRGYKSKLDAIDEYVRKFKELCKTQNFGGILISQINREGADHMSISNLKGSGTLEEHPDSVILLDWDKKKDEYFIRIDKQRHGEVKRVEVEYEPKFFLYTEPVPKVRKERREIWDI